MKVLHHREQVGIQILDLAEIGLRSSELNECVLKNIFRDIVVAARQLHGMSQQLRVAAEESVLVRRAPTDDQL